MRILLGAIIALVGGGLWGFLSHLLIGIPVITGLGVFGIMIIAINFVNRKSDDEE